MRIAISNNNGLHKCIATKNIQKFFNVTNYTTDILNLLDMVNAFLNKPETNKLKQNISIEILKQSMEFPRSRS